MGTIGSKLTHVSSVDRTTVLAVGLILCVIFLDFNSLVTMEWKILEVKTVQLEETRSDAVDASKELIAPAEMIVVVAGAIIVGAYSYRDWRDPFKNEKHRPYCVNSEFMDFMEQLGDYYEFTHKAIWATHQAPSPTLLCKFTNLLRVGENQITECPTNEHSAFVAYGKVRINGNKREALFVAQFNAGDFIQKSGKNRAHKKEGKSTPFPALFTENKRHAAWCVATSHDADVWIKDLQHVKFANHSQRIRNSKGKSLLRKKTKHGIRTTEIKSALRKSADIKLSARHKETNEFILRNLKLASPEFKEEEWENMKQPMKLRKLNECVYQTPCSGKKYDILENNCQHFARHLYDMV